MNLESAAAELYALPPGDFTAHRTTLAAEARSAGGAADAKAIAALRRPTVAAWLVNQLVRGEQGAEAEIEAFEALGGELREAQAQLDGARMKQLTQQRHSLTAALVRRAGELQKLTASVQREVEETFGAALADEQAAAAVFSGRLTRALAYAGFGEVDVTDSTATPIGKRPAAKSSTPSSPSKKLSPEEKAEADRSASEAEAKRRREAAEQAVSAARADLSEVEADVKSSSADLAESRVRESELSERLEQLQREILELRRELDTASRAVATADRLHQRSERQAKDAQKAVTRAEESLARITKD